MIRVPLALRRIFSEKMDEQLREATSNVLQFQQRSSSLEEQLATKSRELRRANDQLADLQLSCDALERKYSQYQTKVQLCMVYVLN